MKNAESMLVHLRNRIADGHTRLDQLEAEEDLPKRYQDTKKVKRSPNPWAQEGTRKGGTQESLQMYEAGRATARARAATKPWERAEIQRRAAAALAEAKRLDPDWDLSHLGIKF